MAVVAPVVVDVPVGTWTKVATNVDNAEMNVHPNFTSASYIYTYRPTAAAAPVGVAERDEEGVPFFYNREPVTIAENLGNFIDAYVWCENVPGRVIIWEGLEGFGGGRLIEGAVDDYASLPLPASSYTGQFYLVRDPSGGVMSWAGRYKYPSGLYTPNASNVWEQTPFSVKVSEDAQTLVSIPSGSWSEYIAVAFDINVGDRLIYDSQTYVNLTGTQGATAPDTDTTNWAHPDLYARTLILDANPGAVLDLAGVCNWNPAEFTMDIHTGIGPVFQVNQEDVEVVYNATAETLYNLTAVNGVDTFNGFSSVIKADSSTHKGIQNVSVTTMDIPPSSYGIVTTRGKIRGVDTTALPGFIPVLYISSDGSGDLTRTRPSFPDYTIVLGAVTLEDAVNGIVTVNIKDQYQNTIVNFWNGCFREAFDFLVTSDGATVTGALSPSNGHPDMTMLFSDGFFILDTTPAKTIVLTPGTATVPQLNFVYIPASTKVLTISTTGFPTEEIIRVSTIALLTAAVTQSDGALRNQNINDHIQSTTDDVGHLSHITTRLRLLDAQWISGTEAVSTAVEPITVAVTAGEVSQLHKQSFPALSMALGDETHIVNDFAIPYYGETDFSNITLDTNGDPLLNTSFSIVVWGVQNKTGETSHIMANLPSGTYSKNFPNNASNDGSNFSVYDIPQTFKGVGFLIARFTYINNGGTWTLHDTENLRGKVPNSTAGGGGGGGGVSTFAALTDTPSSYVGEGGSVVQVAAGETSLEFVKQIDKYADSIANKILNPSFEEGTGVGADNWVLSADAERVVTEPHTGAYSLYTSASAATGSSYQDAIVVEPYTHYEIRAWVYVEAYTSGTAYIDMNDIDGEFSEDIDFGTVGSWQLVTGHWDSREHTSVRLRIVTGTLTGDFYTDDVSFIPIGPGLSSNRTFIEADMFQNPNNSDWPVNSLASIAPDSNNAGLMVRRFDDTTNEGVGWSMYIPADAVNFTMRTISRSEGEGGGTVSLKLYNREVRAGAVDAWTSDDLDNITIGADANFDFHTLDISMATLNAQPGRYIQFELVRDGAGSMTGDWTLLGMEVFFS